MITYEKKLVKDCSKHQLFEAIFDRGQSSIGSHNCDYCKDMGNCTTVHCNDDFECCILWDKIISEIGNELIEVKGSFENNYIEDNNYNFYQVKNYGEEPIILPYKLIEAWNLLGYTYVQGKSNYIYFRIYSNTDIDPIDEEIIINKNTLSYTKRGELITYEEHDLIVQTLNILTKEN